MIHQGNGKSHVGQARTVRLPHAPVRSPERTTWREQFESCIAEYPVMCIAAALTLGAIAGWFVKRR